ncbi:MAG: AAA family ATPase [Novosphingobium sp.]|nr:AAA family ATPase [Novosphingobium sp.]
MAKPLAPKKAAGKSPQPKVDAAAAPPSSRRDLISRLRTHRPRRAGAVVLASLATQSPLLLIGPHGSAKSLLLERLADALGLRWRHYNAALVNFDDLVGYPLPDAQGKLRFVETPASVWGAQAVFIDEISRARLDVQNRLFPIIHERRVQGIPLPDLKHRWAAMNPPVQDDDEDNAYLGSQPLDIALSDRFALQARMPDWQAFDAAQQEAVIRAEQVIADPLAGTLWTAAIAQTGELLPMVDAQWGSSIARYVRILSSLLGATGLQLSARRAGMVSRNLAAVHAARLSADMDAQIDDSAWIAALNSMPFAAAGQKFDEGKLLACHREAWVAADAVAEVYRDVACVQEVSGKVSPNGLRHRIWKTLQQRLGAEPATPVTERKGNLLASLFAANRLGAEEDVHAVLQRYVDVQERLGTATA